MKPRIVTPHSFKKVGYGLKDVRALFDAAEREHTIFTGIKSRFFNPTLIQEDGSAEHYEFNDQRLSSVSVFSTERHLFDKETRQTASGPLTIVWFKEPQRAIIVGHHVYVEYPKKSLFSSKPSSDIYRMYLSQAKEIFDCEFVRRSAPANHTPAARTLEVA